MNIHHMYKQANVQWQKVNNPVVPYPMLQPTSGQQVATNYVSAPMQRHIIPPIRNYPSEDYTSQQLQRMTSTSEEEEETQKNNKNAWQVIRRTERKIIPRTQHNTPETKIETCNRNGLLTNETNKDSTDGNPSSTKIHKPPPIFVHGAINYGEMLKRIRGIAEDEQYCTKVLQIMLLR
jgi:hypothetical protein